MLYYNYFKNDNSNEYIVLLHGLGGSSNIWYKQIDFLKELFNVIYIDLHSHGESKTQKVSMLPCLSFDLVAKDVIEVLNELKIKSAHFIGISLGTVIIRSIEKLYPERIKSMILGGAIVTLRAIPNILLKVVNIFKGMFSYMFIYKIFALIIMPKKNHKKSREIFIREAQKLGKHEFLCWYELMSKINKSQNYLFSKDLIKNNIPKLYIMGNEDHIFLPNVKKYIKKENSNIKIIEYCGHVCNIEKAKEFNEVCLDFFKKLNYCISN